VEDIRQAEAEATFTVQRFLATSLMLYLCKLAATSSSCVVPSCETSSLTGERLGSPIRG